MNQIGIPYDIHNRNGLNCWGLVASVYKDLGVEIPDFKPRNGSPREIANTFARAFASGKHGFKMTQKPSNYCVVVFKRLSKFGQVFHCGVYIDGKVIHSSKGVGMVSMQSMELAGIGYSEVEFWQR